MPPLRTGKIAGGYTAEMQLDDLMLGPVPAHAGSPSPPTEPAPPPQPDYAVTDAGSYSGAGAGVAPPVYYPPATSPEQRMPVGSGEVADATGSYSDLGMRQDVAYDGYTYPTSPEPQTAVGGLPPTDTAVPLWEDNLAQPPTSPDGRAAGLPAEVVDQVTTFGWGDGDDAWPGWPWERDLEYDGTGEAAFFWGPPITSGRVSATRAGTASGPGTGRYPPGINARGGVTTRGGRAAQQGPGINPASGTVARGGRQAVMRGQLQSGQVGVGNPGTQAATLPSTSTVGTGGRAPVNPVNSATVPTRPVAATQATLPSPPPSQPIPPPPPNPVYSGRPSLGQANATRIGTGRPSMGAAGASVPPRTPTGGPRVGTPVAPSAAAATARPAWGRGPRQSGDMRRGAAVAGLGTAGLIAAGNQISQRPGTADPRNAPRSVPQPTPPGDDPNGTTPANITPFPPVRQVSILQPDGSVVRGEAPPARGGGGSAFGRVEVNADGTRGVRSVVAPPASLAAAEARGEIPWALTAPEFDALLAAGQVAESDRTALQDRALLIPAAWADALGMPATSGAPLTNASAPQNPAPVIDALAVAPAASFPTAPAASGGETWNGYDASGGGWSGGGGGGYGTSYDAGGDWYGDGGEYPTMPDLEAARGVLGDDFMAGFAFADRLGSRGLRGRRGRSRRMRGRQVFHDPAPAMPRDDGFPFAARNEAEGRNLERLRALRRR